MAPKLGNFVELMNRYQLVYSSQDYDESLRHATNILKQPASKYEWKIKQERMLSEKINVTQFTVEILEKAASYPNEKISHT